MPGGCSGWLALPVGLLESVGRGFVSMSLAPGDLLQQEQNPPPSVGSQLVGLDWLLKEGLACMLYAMHPTYISGFQIVD